jgi:hypothetical protein
MYVFNLKTELTYKGEKNSLSGHIQTEYKPIAVDLFLTYDEGRTDFNYILGNHTVA